MGRVRGCFGVNTVQQSSNGSMEMSKVSILREMSIISTLSIPISGRSTGMPVLRPLIGMDKVEIIDISRRIDTFDISIEPFEDCCTVFTPKHPRTRPILREVLEAEQALDCEALTEECVNNVKLTKIYPNK